MRNRKHLRIKFHYLILPALGILTVHFTALPASAQAPQPPAVSGQAPKQSPAKQASRPRPPLSVKDGSLTVQAEDSSLQGLVETIGGAARIAVQFAPEVADQKISVEYKDVPVETALQQILKEFDAFYFYGVGEKPPAKLQIIWVYPKTKGRGLEPVPPEQWASTRELKQKLTSKDAETREKAIVELVQRLGEGARSEVLDALSDTDPTVRSRALYKAEEAGLALPQGLLAGLAVSDPSSFVRFLALDGLGGNRDMQAVVERALNDPDQYVQAKAKEILERWSWADRPSQPPRRTTQQAITRQQQPSQGTTQ